MIERVSDLAGEPVVGRFYLVPCVLEVHTRTGWRPVIGPLHDDIEPLNFPFRHWHYDHRFVSAAQHQEMGLSYHPLPRALAYVAHENRVILGPQLMRRKCRRQQPEFPNVVLVKTLELHYKGAQLSDCLRCPHRGFSLKGQPVKNGVVTCPGHGLRFSFATKEIVERGNFQL